MNPEEICGVQVGCIPTSKTQIWSYPLIKKANQEGTTPRELLLLRYTGNWQTVCTVKNLGIIWSSLFISQVQGAVRLFTKLYMISSLNTLR